MIRALALLASSVPVTAEAQVAQTSLRYDEDWSQIRGRPDRETHWWTRMKDLPVERTENLRVTLGAEARARYEAFDRDPANFSTRGDGYLWFRLMPFADVQDRSLRAFVQGIAGYSAGVRAGPGPADETGIDLLQGFVDVRLSISANTKVTFRAGRELVALGSERLIGVRYGPNVPQAFDGPRIIVDSGSTKIQLFHLRPVATGQRHFDDHADRAKTIDGLYATSMPISAPGIDLYVLHYRNDAARYAGVVARERRVSLGIRSFGKRGRASWNWEAILQRGRFGREAINAWSLATETSYALPALPLRPTLRLRANAASGDRAKEDGQLGTFNALFPKGKYFGELTPLGPRNILNVHPSAEVDLSPQVSAALAAVAYWRFSRRDGIYDVPGTLIRPPGGSSARHIGNQAEFSVAWQATPVLSISASASIFAPGGFLKETGSKRPIRMVGAETMLRY